jgi:ATP-dependent Clp protease ATP-binding subunit ClpX
LVCSFSIGIIHIDEVDKLARRPGDTSSKDVSGEGVQQALLRILEGSVVQVTDRGNGRSNTREGLPNGPLAYGGAGGKGEVYNIDTSNILFILSGAFVGLENVIKERVSKGASRECCSPGCCCFG